MLISRRECVILSDEVSFENYLMHKRLFFSPQRLSGIETYEPQDNDSDVNAEIYQREIVFLMIRLLP